MAVEPFHLFRYVDDQAFRLNNRLHEDGTKISDAEPFENVGKQIVGRQLTNQGLTGKEEQRPEEGF